MAPSLLIALALIQSDPGKTEALDHTALNGVYAELQASGHTGCNTAGIPRSLDIRVLSSPPHARSANIGEFGARLGPGDSTGFVVAGVPVLEADADGGHTVSLGGGHVNTVGRHVDGITDGQLRGHYDVRMRRDADGRLWLLEMNYADRHPSRITEILVEDGRLPDGTVLRAFERCGDASPRR